jgi:hypothetical protein
VKNIGFSALIFVGKSHFSVFGVQAIINETVSRKKRGTVDAKPFLVPIFLVLTSTNLMVWFLFWTPNHEKLVVDRLMGARKPSQFSPKPFQVEEDFSCHSPSLIP